MILLFQPGSHNLLSAIYISYIYHMYIYIIYIYIICIYISYIYINPRCTSNTSTYKTKQCNHYYSPMQNHHCITTVSPPWFSLWYAHFWHTQPAQGRHIVYYIPIIFHEYFINLHYVFRFPYFLENIWGGAVATIYVKFENVTTVYCICLLNGIRKKFP